MLEWLKTILGDHYTEDIDKQISAEIGKGFVARADFNAKNDELKTAQTQLKTAQDGLKAFEGVDVNDLKGQISKLQGELTAQEDAFAFDSALDGAIRDAKAYNVQAVRGMLDVAALKASKDRTADIEAALERLVKEQPWAFNAATPADPTPPGNPSAQGGIRISSAAAHGAPGRADYDSMSDAEYYAAVLKPQK